MGKTLSDEDIDAIATRVVQIIGTRFSAEEPHRETPPPPPPPAPQPEPAKPLPRKLAFTLKELSAELGISKASVYRLDARGLLKSLPYLRTKIFSREEVEKFLSGRGGEPTTRITMQRSRMKR
jgi:hypothetical protein